MKKKSILALFFILAIILGLVIYRMLWQRYEDKQADASYHVHANFRVVVNGKDFDFTKPGYMSVEPCDDEEASSLFFVSYANAHSESSDELRDVVHLHNSVGDVVHVHQRGITWHAFFESLQMQLESDQFIDDEGHASINNDTHQLSFFLNGKRVDDISEMEIHDLDHALIVYATKDRSAESLLAAYPVGDTACQYSGSCPTRGAVTQESCTSGIQPTWYEKLLFPK